MPTINQYYPETVTHPSLFLEEILEEKKMGAKEFAIKTGKPEKTISAVLKGKSAITPDMAILFEQVLKIPAHFWIEAQKNYDEYQARINYQKSINDAQEWAKTFPYSKMASFGWIKKTRKIEEKVINLFNYFEVATQKGFEDYYYNQRSQVAFRISLHNQEHAPVIASWLRQGELQASQINVPNFNKVKLKQALPELKKIMATQPSDFFSQIKNICNEVGVKIVHTPCLPNAPIHGSTRWVADAPLIQLSGRYKRNDIFWFTFFHEIGHILLHGKKYISVENMKIDGENEIFEKEADEFSSEIILKKKEEIEITSLNKISKEDILHFSKKYGTHPASIIGRLQHLGIISYGEGNEFFKPIDFN